MATIAFPSTPPPMFDRVSSNGSVFLLGSSPSASFFNVGRRARHAVAAAAADDPSAASNHTLETARRLYVGNIPRTITNDELASIFGKHGSVEKAEVMYDKYSCRNRRLAFVTMGTVDDANAAIQMLNDTEIEDQKIKVNIAEPILDRSVVEAEDSKFIDSPYKIYVGKFSKRLTSEALAEFFFDKGKILSAKVSRDPRTYKSRGYGYATFSSEEDMEAAISMCKYATLQGEKIRVNKV